MVDALATRIRSKRPRIRRLGVAVVRHCGMTTNPRRAPARRTESSSPSNATRATFLESKAESIGKHWSTAIRSSLERQHRGVVGGFPGTLSEIRKHVDDFLRPLLSEARMKALTATERETSARQAYAIARKDWLANRASED